MIGWMDACIMTRRKATFLTFNAKPLGITVSRC